MLRQSLTNFTVLLVGTWIVFSIKVHGIHLEEVPPCRELLASIPITFTDVLEVNVNLTKLQQCIDLWTEWRDERVLIGGFSVPSPMRLTKELDRMLTQQARQTAAARPARPEQFEHPNVAADVHQPSAINRKRNRGGKEGRPEAKRFKVELPARPSDFLQVPQPIPYLKPKSPQATASIEEQCNLNEISSSEDISNLWEQCAFIWEQQIKSGDLSILPKVNEFKEMIDIATDARPALTEQVKQPNVVAEAHESASLQGNQPEVVAAGRRPQSSVASDLEVQLELYQLRHDTKSERPYTESHKCTDQVASLLETPNQPTPTAYDLAKLKYILQDCAKVWEMLRVKAMNDKVKQDRLANELRLLTERLVQIEKITRARENLRNVMKPIVIATCDDLLLHPWNLHDSTMELKLQYKDQLNECITKWKQRIPNQQSNKRQKKILLSELVKLKAELTRVNHLIRQNQQNVAAGRGGLGGQPMAQLSKMAASSALHPHHLLQPKLKNPPSAALGKEPGPSGGGSNRNFDIPWGHRSKHSKKVRNRMAKSKPKLPKLL